MERTVTKTSLKTEHTDTQTSLKQEHTDTQTSLKQERTENRRQLNRSTPTIRQMKTDAYQHLNVARTGTPWRKHRQDAIAIARQDVTS